MPFMNSIAAQFGKTVQKSHSLFARFGWIFALLFILLFAFALRIIFYTGVLDGDTLEYAYYAYGASQGDFQFTLVPGDIQFRLALYLPLSLLYSLLGPSEFSTVLYALLASLFGVLFIYGIGRLQANESAGIAAALLWAAFPLNVFLSTLFGPDEIVASFTMASVFFLLWGNKLRGKKALFCYILGLGFAVLGVFVKPSAVIIFVFVGIFFTFKASQYWRRPLRVWTEKMNPSVLSTILASGGLLILVIGFLYFQGQWQPFLLSLFRASSDFADLFVLGKTHEYVRGEWALSTLLFLVASPVFVVALAGSIAKRLRGSVLPLLWAAAMFLYFEWGSISTNPAVYSPFLARMNDRNTLFVFAPFVVLVGIFFAQWLKANQARWLAALSLVIVLPIAWLQKEAHFAGLPQEIVSFSVMAALIGTLPVLIYLNDKSAKYKPILLIGWLTAMLVAFLYPTPPLHISAERWQSQISYRRVVKEAANFFLDHPEYPILALSGGNARELNFLSNFKLGYSVYGVEQPNARIQVVSDPKLWTGSAYIFLRDEINQIQPVPTNWWKTAEYDPGSGKPMLIYRTLSTADAASELEAAIRAVEQAHNTLNLERLLGAGINASNVEISIEAWHLLNQIDPKDYPLDLISPLVIDKYYDNEINLSPNLLAGTLGELQIDQIIQEAVSIENVAGESILSVTINQPLNGQFGVFDEIVLRPESLYILVIDVQSTTGVNLLRVAGGEVADSREYSDIHGEWEEEVVIFYTPAWAGEMQARLDLFTVNKSGFVAIKNPRLYLAEFE